MHVVMAFNSYFLVSIFVHRNFSILSLTHLRYIIRYSLIKQMIFKRFYIKNLLLLYKSVSLHMSVPYFVTNIRLNIRIISYVLTYCVIYSVLVRCVLILNI